MEVPVTSFSRRFSQEFAVAKFGEKKVFNTRL